MSTSCFHTACLIPERPFSISLRCLQERNCQPTTEPPLREMWPDSQAGLVTSQHSRPALHPPGIPGGTQNHLILFCLHTFAQAIPSAWDILSPTVTSSSCKAQLSVTSSGDFSFCPEAGPYPSLTSRAHSSPTIICIIPQGSFQFTHFFPHQTMSSLRADSLTQSVTLVPEPPAQGQ